MLNSETGLEEKKLDIAPYTAMVKLDPFEMEALQALLNGPQVDCYYGDDRETDMVATYLDNATGKQVATRICGVSPTLNGVRWNITPGKNTIPRPIYEFMLSVPQQVHMFSEMDENGNLRKASAPQSLTGDNMGRQLHYFT